MGRTKSRPLLEVPEPLPDGVGPVAELVGRKVLQQVAVASVTNEPFAEMPIAPEPLFYRDPICLTLSDNGHLPGGAAVRLPTSQPRRGLLYAGVRDNRSKIQEATYSARLDSVWTHSAGRERSSNPPTHLLQANEWAFGINP